MAKKKTLWLVGVVALVVVVVVVAVLWNQSRSSLPSGPSELVLTNNINDSPWITFTAEATFDRTIGGCINPLPGDVNCDSSWGKSQVGAAIAKVVGQPPNQCPPCEFYEEEAKHYTRIRLSIGSSERVVLLVYYLDMSYGSLLSEVTQGVNVYVVDLPDWPFYGHFHIELETFDQAADIQIEVIAFRMG